MHDSLENIVLSPLLLWQLVVWHNARVFFFVGVFYRPVFPACGFFFGQPAIMRVAWAGIRIAKVELNAFDC